MKKTAREGADAEQCRAAACTAALVVTVVSDVDIAARAEQLSSWPKEAEVGIRADADV